MEDIKIIEENMTPSNFIHDFIDEDLKTKAYIKFCMELDKLKYDKDDFND